MMPGIKIPLVFFASDAGNEPVRKWLRALPEPDRRVVGQDLMRVQWRWPVGMPLCRNLGGGLWEVRCSLAGNRIATVIFCLYEGQLIALHAFIKKARKTPKVDLELATKRKEELV